jgi:Zn-finger nucleic acid-binding protein
MCGKPLAEAVETSVAGRRCPGCNDVLAAVEVGPYALCPCGACGGIWMDRGAFDALAKSRETRDVFLESPHGSRQEAAPVPDPMEVRYRSCPSCGKLMNRQNYARISGVVIDVCREHGFWFDRDELRKVVVFIEGGGLDRAARREREQRPLAPVAPEPTWRPEGSASIELDLPTRLGAALLEAAWRVLGPSR